MKAISFNLRPSAGEQSLSFYAEADVDLGQVLGEAPGPGWGVLMLTVGDLQDLGFEIRSAEDDADPVIGHAHVLATPPSYDEGGQIPLELREALAVRSTWLQEPDRR